MRVCLFTMYGDNYLPIAAVTTPNFREYCRCHGYEYSELILDGGGNEYAYKKHECLTELMQGDFDLIWYLDCDAIITDIRIPITDFLDDDYSVFITQDVTEINGGSIIIKNNDWGKFFNNYILMRRKEYENEQNVINAMYRMFYEHIKILPHPSINSYDYTLYPELPHIRQIEQGHWKPGCFVLHTPGAAFEKRLETLKNAKIFK